MADEAVYLGIDSYQPQFITSSNGIREQWSYVGYPKDHVARKKFGGRDIIYGKEAVENRLALNPIAHSLAAQLRKLAAKTATTSWSIRDLLEHTVELAKVPKGSTIYSVIGACEASKGKAAIIEQLVMHRLCYRMLRAVCCSLWP